MDTRTKIVSLDAARAIAGRGATVVSGFFDPMTHLHAERLQGLKRNGRPLLILVATPSNAILPGTARAQLVAALACVDHVAEMGATFPEGLVPNARLETEDTERLDQLIQHVQARQQAAR